MTELSFDAKILVSDALANNRKHVRPLGGMSDRVIKGRRQPLNISPANALPDDPAHLRNEIKRLNAELDQLEKMIWEMINSMSTQQDVHTLNADLIARLTEQRKRALLTARRRGRKTANVADLTGDAAQVINRLQDQINDLRSGFEIVRTALDNAGAPPAIGLHMRIKGMAVEFKSWKVRALKAEAYNRQQTRDDALADHRRRANESLTTAIQIAMEQIDSQHPAYNILHKAINPTAVIA